MRYTEEYDSKTKRRKEGKRKWKDNEKGLEKRKEKRMSSKENQSQSCDRNRQKLGQIYTATCTTCKIKIK